MSMSTKEIVELAQKHLMGNIKRYDMAFVKGSGMKLWDAEGKEYLDFLSGVAVCALGHSPEVFAKAVCEQVHQLTHVSNYFYTEPLVRLAERLTKATGLDKIFFCNSGAEANEAAIKLARKYSHDKYGSGRHVIITAWGSFHGRTMAAVSATGQEKVKAGFEPLLPGFVHVPFGDLEALAKAVGPETCAVMLEPVQGEGGVVTPPPRYLPEVARLCEKLDLLLILDEVQTGLGRTGRAMAYEHFGIKPHIASLGKGLGGGYPVGAIAAADEVSRAFTPGSHSTTIGGAPLAMAAGLAMTGEILAPEFLARVTETGQYFLDRLGDLARDLGPKLVWQARGLGLMLGLELTKPSGPVAADMHRRGFLVNATADTALRFVPPLIVTPAEIDLLIPALKESITSIYSA